MTNINRITAWAKLLTGVKGCRVFIAAILSGDVATEQELEVKRAVCLVCPHRVERWGSSWCGVPFVDRTSPLIPKWLRTCGCNLAGMLRVGSKRCVQGRHDEPLAKLARLTVEGQDSARVAQDGDQNNQANRDHDQDKQQ